MTPAEFYESSVSDYRQVQTGWKNRMQLIESYARRQAYVVGSAIVAVHGGKGFDNWFESVWPYGDKKIHEDMAQMIKQKRERGKQLMVKLSDNLQLHEAIKGLKKNGRRSVHTNRR